MNQDLLGYLLNALEPNEKAEVERYLETSGEARERLAALRQKLQPLSYDAEAPAPPPELFFNTLRRIAEQRCCKPATIQIPHGRAATTAGSWRRLDVLIAAAIVFIALLLVPKSIMYVREAQIQRECAGNLGHLYQALMHYAGDHHGSLPAPEEKGPLAPAGVYAVKLADGGYLGTDARIYCPANRRSALPHDYPNPEALKAKFDTDEYRGWIKQIGGCYGYHLGYLDRGGRLHAIRQDDDPRTPIIADRPARFEESPRWNAVNSPNHSSRGQNVLFLDGNVAFFRSRAIGQDDIYLNHFLRQAAGRHARDAVIAPSEVPPIPD
jgi:prepilin-type processing-associated H-X9-DG protein